MVIVARVVETAVPIDSDDIIVIVCFVSVIISVDDSNNEVDVVSFFVIVNGVKDLAVDVVDCLVAHPTSPIFNPCRAVPELKQKEVKINHLHFESNNKNTCRRFNFGNRIVAVIRYI